MTYRIRKIIVLLLPAIITAAAVWSADLGVVNSDPDFAQVQGVRLRLRGDGSWDVQVSVFHNDEGWDHYADAWVVQDDETGTVLGERILAHPHDTEQPFTRSLMGIEIPTKIKAVRIRSKCNVHGYGGREIVVPMPAGPRPSGLEIEVD